MPTDKFGSLSLSRAYIDTLQDGIGSLEGGELISALERLDDAFAVLADLGLDEGRDALGAATWIASAWDQNASLRVMSPAAAIRPG